METMLFEMKLVIAGNMTLGRRNNYLLDPKIS